MKIEKTDLVVIEQLVEVMKECLQYAPVDFLGTGSNSKAAYQEELEWRDKWQGSYIAVSDIISKTKALGE